MSTELFRERDREFTAWMHRHPDGYVANLLAQGSRPEYPMVHRSLCSTLTRYENYTSGDYMKVCATDLQELEAWSQREHRRGLARCKVCFR